jgi:6-phosphogluconolactonase (cycloisomerase 2 family)
MKTTTDLLLKFVRRVISTAAVSVAALGATGALTQAGADGGSGAVYTLTNKAAGNAVAVFKRAADGTLTPSGEVATNGLGSGGGLGSQGALVLSKNDRWLYAVNAGSNDISVFAVKPEGLMLASKVNSGGVRPVSVTVRDDVLYVLNGGGSGNISGFRIGEHGALRPIAGSTQPLSGNATAPAQIEFNRDGDVLVVTEKATNKISLYPVHDDVARAPLVRDSLGMTPFGFAFDKRDHLIVSEAFGGRPGLSALSSYDIEEHRHNLQTISASVGDTQTAACWVVVTRNGRYAYTSNTGSNTISGYSVDRHGRLALLSGGAKAGVTGAGPTDMALSGNSKFLYAITPGSGEIAAFRAEADGSLTALPGARGIPASTVGLAAH